MTRKGARVIYQPPFTLTPAIANQCARIAERVGRLSLLTEQADTLRLRRLNRIRSIHGSLAIEGNTLSEAQITALLDGKRVLAPPREIQEAHNAIAAYDRLSHWLPHREGDLLDAHRSLMTGLLPDAGCYRRGGVGVMDGRRVLHMAPPASRVPILMRQLLQWTARSDAHPLITSSVFHYEFEFIHPFTDGNGRMGRLWQTLLLCRWQPLFTYLPVESMVHRHQSQYYEAIRRSTADADASAFVHFMLGMILDAVEAVADVPGVSEATPHVTLHVTPHVDASTGTPIDRLLAVLQGEMSRETLMSRLALSDRKSFSERYLRPALQQGLIEMTRPDTPRSRLQTYRRKGEAPRRA
ncbi:MAG: hypothetical protein RL572_1247 [Pseudomonadota bacterium]